MAEEKPAERQPSKVRGVIRGCLKGCWGSVTKMALGNYHWEEDHRARSHENKSLEDHSGAPTQLWRFPQHFGAYRAGSGCGFCLSVEPEQQAGLVVVGGVTAVMQ